MRSKEISSSPPTSTGLQGDIAGADVTNVSHGGATSVATIVSKQIIAHERRKRNVIVTGLPEQPDTDDCTSFVNLCETHMPTKPYV